MTASNTIVSLFSSIHLLLKLLHFCYTTKQLKYVKINFSYSDWGNTNFGVPQGSAL